MRLVVIVPCLNEEKTVGVVLDGIPKVIEGIDEIVRVVVDDGSDDATAEIARKRGAVVVRHPSNQGVGAAFGSGIEEALRQRADVIVNMDGDGQFDPRDVPRLIRPILEEQAEFVTASRFADPSLVPEMPRLKRWGNARIAELVSSLVGERFHDVSCGFRAYTREAALHLTLVGKFTYTQETFLDLAFKGFRILEVPLRVRGEREFGQSRVAKSVARYAVNSARIIFRSYRDYRPLQVFGALAAWCLLAALVLLGILGFHYATTGRFSGQLWAGFTGGAFGFLSVLFLLVGIVADMLDRIRLHQERILYYQKRMMYFDEGQGRDGAGERRKPPRR